MAKPKPDYRTDTLACPLNPGKLAKVIELVLAMRQCAKREAQLQWQQFFERGWQGFEATARQGWIRPWVKDQTLTVSHAQMVMSQVAASLQGHLGNVQNTFVELVAGLPCHLVFATSFISSTRNTPGFGGVRFRWNKWCQRSTPKQASCVKSPAKPWCRRT